MKNILSSLTTSEKNRILEMHKRATSNNYLKESLEVSQGIQDLGTQYECKDTPELKKSYDFLKDCYEVMDQQKKNSMGMGSPSMKMFRYKDKVPSAKNGDYYIGWYKHGIDCMVSLYGDIVSLGQDPNENTETGEAVAGGMRIGTGTKFENGLTITDESKIKTYTGGNNSKVVWLPTDERGTGNEFNCTRHEMGKYILFPTGNGKYTLTKEESQALYNKYCKK
jgi:hypothetical protein